MEKSPSRIPHHALASPGMQPPLPPNSPLLTAPSAAHLAPTPPSAPPKEARPLKEPKFPAHIPRRPQPQNLPPMPSVAPSFARHLAPKSLGPHSDQPKTRPAP